MNYGRRVRTLRFNIAVVRYLAEKNHVGHDLSPLLDLRFGEDRVGHPRRDGIRVIDEFGHVRGARLGVLLAPRLASQLVETNGAKVLRIDLRQQERNLLRVERQVGLDEGL